MIASSQRNKEIAITHRQSHSIPKFHTLWVGCDWRGVMVLILLVRSVVGQIPFSLLGKSFCLLYTCSIVLTRPEENPEWKFHFVIRVYCRSLCSRPSFSSGSPSSLPPPLQKERELCTDCNSWWKDGGGEGREKEGENQEKWGGRKWGEEQEGGDGERRQGWCNQSGLSGFELTIFLTT